MGVGSMCCGYIRKSGLDGWVTFYSELYPNDSRQRLLIYSSIPRVLVSIEMEQVWYNHGFGDAFLLKDIEVGNQLILVSKSAIDI